MAQNQSQSLHQGTDQPENPLSPVDPQTTPIVCHMCDMVFFDNVSLVLHAGCHFNADEPNPRPFTGKLPNPVSSGPSTPPVQPAQPWHMNPVQLGPQPPPQMTHPCPNLDLNGGPSDDGNMVIDYFNPYSLPAINPVFAAHPVNHPMFFNPIPPLNPFSSSSLFKNTVSYVNLQPPTNPNIYPTMNQYGFTSPSTNPYLYSPLGSNTFDVDGFQVKRELTDWYTQNTKNLEMNHTCQKPEIIIISDDEEEDNKNEELDLTLRL